MKSRVVIWACVAVAVVLAILLVWVVTRDLSAPDASARPTPASTTSATPEPSPVPEPAPTTAPDDIEKMTSEMLAPFVSAEAALRGAPEAPLAISDIATGNALEDLGVDARELAESGLVQVGSPEVIDAIVMDADVTGAPPTATVLACLDYSKVDMQTADGTSVKDVHAAQRVPTLFTLVKVENRWLVSNRTFPDEPTC